MEQITQPVSPVTNLPQEKPKKGYDVIIVFLVLIAIILFSPIPYYQTEEVICTIGQSCPKIGWYTNKSLFQNILTSFQKHTPSAIIPPDPTANWKTYVNSSQTFSFKYPSDYFTFQEEYSNIGTYLAPSQGEGGTGPKFLKPTDVWLEASLLSGANLKSIEEYFMLPGQQNYSASAKKTQTTIGGMGGYIIEHNFPVAAGDIIQYSKVGIVLRNEIIYTISISAWSQEVLQTNQTLFKQILSTFTFLDTSSAQQVLGIQLTQCCSCPIMIEVSHIGKGGWVVYEQGKNYDAERPSACRQPNIGACKPCAQAGNTTYTCPVNGWQNCMPVLSPEGQVACSPEAMEWYKANCPNFKGAAL